MNAPIRRVRRLLAPLYAGLLLASALSAQAVSDSPLSAASSLVISNISYVDWTAARVGRLGRASGLIISNLFGRVVKSIEVTYEGEVTPASQISGGIDYWNPKTPYLSTTISNLPPTADIITLSEDATFNTLLFSEPVKDPVLLLNSVGRHGLGVGYLFDAPFELLSQGPGYWGAGELIRSEPNVLLGYEGHGAIQFPGIHSALSWRVDGAEDWHGFTVGIPVAVATAVPEGGTTLSGLAVVGLAFRLWSRRKRGQS